MSRISSAKNYVTFHVSESSPELNTKCSIGRESEKGGRDILLPGQNWKIYRSVWHNSELRRIKTASRVITKEEIRRHTEKHEADRKRLELESEQRKQFLQKIDKTREAKLTKKQNENNDIKKISNPVFFAKHEDVSVFYLFVYFIFGIWLVANGDNACTSFIAAAEFHFISAKVFKSFYT